MVKAGGGRRAGLRIQRMPSEVGQEFGEPAQYPYMVVCSPSCHDTSTTRAWWEEDAARRHRFAAEALPTHVGPRTHALPHTGSGLPHPCVPANLTCKE